MLRFLFFVLFVSLSSAQAKSQQDILFPKNLTTSKALEACYRYLSEKKEWQRTCANWKDFTSLVDQQKKIAPELRFLYSQLAILEIKRLRDHILVLPVTSGAHQKKLPFGFENQMDHRSGQDFFEKYPEGDQKFPAFQVHKKIMIDQEPDSPEPRYDSVEGAFLSATEPVLLSIEKWLLPLQKSNHALEADAHYLKAIAYGEALRFEKVLNVLKTHWKQISSSTQRQRDVYLKMSSWTKLFGAIPLRDWFYREMMRVRPSKITGKRTIELFYYLESLRLSKPDEESKTAIESVLKTLRSLWIVHNSKEERSDILNLVDQLRLKSKFVPPTLESLSASELLEQAQAYVRRLDGDAALKSVSQILSETRKDQVTDDQLWETMQVHIRIMRIMDRRPQIPALLENYVRRGQYLKFDESDPQFEKSSRRVLEIAKFEWTYGSHGKSLGLLQRLLTLHKNKSLSKKLLGEIHYVKARIMEQSKDKDVADVVISDALNLRFFSRDQEYDLRWRQFFLKLNLAYTKKNFSGLENHLADIEPLLLDAYEKLRFLYWSASLAMFQENKDLAKSLFSKVYASEPMSYYGNLSALSLQAMGVELKEWLKPAEKNIEEPKWSQFVKDDGFPKEKSYKVLARTLLLSRANSQELLLESLDDLSRQLWSFVPSSKAASLSNRLEFARATMWLFTDLGEPMSALRAADIVVTTLKEETPYDLKFLYPLAYWDTIQKYGQQNNVDPWFTVSLIRQESAFKLNARSWANALGLMQMIPPVAENEAKLVGLENFENESLMEDFDLSIRLGVHHLGGLSKRFQGSWMCVLAGYNAGSPPVHDWLKYYPSPIPLTFVERISYTETRLYVMTIFRNYMNYHRIHGEGKISLAELNQIPRN